MKRIALLSILFLIFSPGCATVKDVPVAPPSEKIEVIRWEGWRIDTVYIEIPKIVERIVTRDTTSTLENDFAASSAIIDHEGYLHHSLETKPQKWPAIAQAKVEHRDSIVYVDRIVEKEVPAELTWGQRTKIDLFWVVFGVAAVLALILIGRKL